MENQNKFVVGEKYYYIKDYYDGRQGDCKIVYKVIKKTKCFITIINKKYKIKYSGNCENVSLGSYAYAPSLWAVNIYKETESENNL